MNSFMEPNRPYTFVYACEPAKLWLHRYIQIFLMATFFVCYLLDFVTVSYFDKFMLSAAVIGLVNFAVRSPKRYEIYHDRISIKVTEHFEFSIDFEDVFETSVGGSWGCTMSVWNFGTYFSQPVVVNRLKGWDVVLTPATPDEFVRQLQKALDTYRSGPSSIQP